MFSPQSDDSPSSRAVSPMHRRDSGSASKTKSLPKGKRRLFNAKVRTGCITCKKRRVKCGEEKPRCERCAKFGVLCDGYASEKTPLAVPYLLPKGSRSTTPSRSLGSSAEVLSNATSSHPAPPETQEFHIYYEETSEHIRGIFQNSFWEKLASIELCKNNCFIRHGIIAIGMLRQRVRIRKTVPASLLEREGSEDCFSYSCALNHYDQALQGIRAAIANKHCANGIRIALIACLLVFCFESLQGNQHSAILQARSGLMLLENWMSSKFSEASGETTVDGIMDQDLMDSFAALESQVALVSSGRQEGLTCAGDYDSTVGSESSYYGESGPLSEGDVGTSGDF